MDIPKEALQRYLTWNGMLQALDETDNPLPDGAKRLVSRAILLLRQWFSDSWLQRGGQLADLPYSPHNKTLLNALHLATVAALFDSGRTLPGGDELFHDTVDIQESRWLHTVTILELAWRLGDGANAVVVDLEPVLEDGHKCDLAVTLDGRRTYIEVTTKGDTQRQRLADRQFHVVSNINFFVESQWAVNIQAEIIQAPPKRSEDFGQWGDQYSAEVKALAQAVVSEGIPKSAECSDVKVTVYPSGHPDFDPSHVLTGSPVETDVSKLLYRSVKEKAQQGSSASPLMIWLYDAAGNLRCTPWSQMSSRNKCQSLHDLLGPIRDQYPNLVAAIITTPPLAVIPGSPMLSGAWGWSSAWSMATAGYVESHAVQFQSSLVLDQLGRITRTPHQKWVTRLLVEAGFDRDDVEGIFEALLEERAHS